MNGGLQMGKRFLTARDIDEHANNGIFVIHVCDEVVVTDIGRERARERGVKLERLPPGAMPAPHPECNAAPADQIAERVRAAVIAKLGSAPDNLDAIISKVVNGSK
jgi:hypothetical protein